MSGECQRADCAAVRQALANLIAAVDCERLAREGAELERRIAQLTAIERQQNIDSIRHAERYRAILLAGKR